jgi:CubicO group peptidase (beta-lactamase class C family)
MAGATVLQPGATPDYRCDMNDIVAIVEGFLAAWPVPALALAIVQDNEPIFVRAFGHCGPANDLPATTSTQFPIGSVTKSVTATVLGMLVDEGRLDLDTPVSEYMPKFRLKDPLASAHLTSRDMLTHRSGLPAHDWIHLSPRLDREGLVMALRYLEPSCEFRTRFQYNNLIYVALGALAECVSGKSYEALVRRCFDALRMTTSSCNGTALAHDATWAVPHGLIDNMMRPIPYMESAATPAYGLSSSASDMANYLRFHLGLGEFEGRQILSEASARQMQSPLMYRNHRSPYPEFGDDFYGLGFGVTTYRGERLVRHAGGLPGFRTSLVMLPERRLGAAALTNGSGHPVAEMLPLAVLDHLCGWSPSPWLDRARADREDVTNSLASDGSITTPPRRSGTTPSHALDEYAGEFDHAAYGTITIRVLDDDLYLTTPGVESKLIHRHFDIFAFPPDPDLGFDGMTVTFGYNRDGEIDRLAIPFEPLVPDIVFDRKVG